MNEKIILIPDDIDRIETLASKGFGLRAIAKHIGVGLETLRRRRLDTPEVNEALKRGREIEEKSLVDSLLARALDPKNNAGAAAAMFLLKTRHNYRENIETDTDNRVAVVVNVPAALKPEEYAKLVEVHTQALEGGNDAK